MLPLKQCLGTWQHWNWQLMLTRTCTLSINISNPLLFINNHHCPALEHAHVIHEICVFYSHWLLKDEGSILVVKDMHSTLQWMSCAAIEPLRLRLSKYKTTVYQTLHQSSWQWKRWLHTKTTAVWWSQIRSVQDSSKRISRAHAQWSVLSVLTRCDVVATAYVMPGPRFD